MTIQKTLHTKSRLFRDLLVAVVFLAIGIVIMPTHFLTSNRIGDAEFNGLMSGLALGFGFAWLIHTLRVARSTGQLDRANHLNFDDKE